MGYYGFMFLSTPATAIVGVATAFTVIMTCLTGDYCGTSESTTLCFNDTSQYGSSYVVSPACHTFFLGDNFTYNITFEKASAPCDIQVTGTYEDDYNVYQNISFDTEVEDNLNAQVTNSDGLQTALSSGLTDITLACGYYSPPSHGSFNITTDNTSITASSPGCVIIQCATSDSYGFYLQASSAHLSGLIIQSCAVGVFVGTGSQYSTLDISAVINNYNHIGLGSGIHVLVGGSINISNSHIEKNNGNAGLYVLGQASVSNTIISYNIGTGITARYGGNVNVFRTKIVHNSGGGIYLSESSIFKCDYCNITSNAAPYGAGIDLVNSTVQLSNSLVKYNIAKTNGGGIAAFGPSSHLSITVSQVAENVCSNKAGFADFYFSGSPQIAISKSRISNEQPGYGFCCDHTHKTHPIYNEVCTYPANC